MAQRNGRSKQIRGLAATGGLGPGLPAVIKEKRFENVIPGYQFGRGNSPILEMDPFSYLRRAQAFDKQRTLLIARKAENHPGKYDALALKLPM
jgi:hypothetical protein